MTSKDQTDLLWLLQCYGYILPRNSSTRATDFAHLIEQRCSRDNEHNRRAAEIARAAGGRFDYGTHLISWHKD